MYFDLRLQRAAGSSPLNTALLERAAALGYAAVAWEVTVTSGRVLQSHVDSLVPVELSPAAGQAAARSPAQQPPHQVLRLSAPPGVATAESAGGAGAVRQLFRLSYLLAKPSDAAALTVSNPLLRSFDVVAVMPVDEKTFQSACLQLDVDIITLDCGDRLPFILKPVWLYTAVKRGVVFEISYGQALRDPSARRHFVSNALNLVRVLKGRGLLFTSHAAAAFELRSPEDAVNIGLLMGVRADLALRAVSAAAREALARGFTRRTNKGALAALPLRVAAGSGLAPGGAESDAGDDDAEVLT